MKKPLLALLIAAGAGVGIYLFTRKKSSGAGSSSFGIAGKGMPIDGCVDVPPQYRGYTESGNWWAAIDKGMRSHLGYPDTKRTGADGLTHHGLVMGFFKAADIEPSTSACRTFKAQIKKWIAEDGIRHWEGMEVGVLSCNP